MPVLAAAAGHDAHDAPDAPAVFGRVAARLHLDLVHEVHHDTLAGDTHHRVRGVEAVHEVAVLRRARPVDREAR